MPKQLTWFDLSKLDNGTRVVFVEPHDIFPLLIVEAGMTGTVTNNSLNELHCLFGLLPDDAALRAALSEWDGEVILYAHELAASDDPDDITTEWHKPSPLALFDDDNPSFGGRIKLDPGA